MTKDRFYLNTPYSEKELVKQLECASFVFEQQIKEMQDREEPSQCIFTVKGCGMAE